MTVKHTYIALCTMLSCSTLAAQHEKIKPEFDNCLRLEYIFWNEKSFTLGANHVFNTPQLTEFVIGYTALFGSAGYAQHNGNTLLNAHAGIEWYELLWGARLGLNATTNMHHITLALLPEAGFTAMGFVNVMYGYNLALWQNEIDGFKSHQISFGLAIPVRKDDDWIWYD